MTWQPPGPQNPHHWQPHAHAAPQHGNPAQQYPAQHHAGQAAQQYPQGGHAQPVAATASKPGDALEYGGSRAEVLGKMEERWTAEKQHRATRRGGCLVALAAPVLCVGTIYTIAKFRLFKSLSSESVAGGLFLFFLCMLIGGVAVFLTGNSKEVGTRFDLVRKLMLSFAGAPTLPLSIRFDTRHFNTKEVSSEGKRWDASGETTGYYDPWLALEGKLDPVTSFQFRRLTTRQSRVRQYREMDKDVTATTCVSLIFDELSCTYPPGTRPQLVALGDEAAAQLQQPSTKATVTVSNTDGEFTIRYRYPFGMKDEDEIMDGMHGGDALVLPFSEARRMLGIATTVGAAGQPV